MWNYTKFAALVLMGLSISSVASANTNNVNSALRTVSRNEIAQCQLDTTAIEQLHEIRTERKHTKLMLQNIEGANDRLVNNARRQLQKRLVKIERAEQFVLSQSCE